MTNRTRWSVPGVFALFSIASTDLALVSQTSFGHRPALVLIGPLMAAAGAVLFALWLGSHG